MNNFKYATRFLFSAFMGWYLMIPPPGDPYKKQPIDPRAPLSMWKQIDSYDSAKRCKSDFGTKVYLSQIQLSSDTKQSSKRTDRVFLDQRSASICLVVS